MKLKWKTCFRVGVTVAILYLMIHYWNAIAIGIGIAFHAAAPLFTGMMIAYAVNILMSFYQKHYFSKSKKKWVKKTRTGICVLLSYISLIGIIAVIIGLVVPELINCVKLLIVKIPLLMQRVSIQLRGNDEMTRLWAELGSATKTGQINWKEIISTVANWAAGGLGGAFGIVKNAITSTFSTAFTIVMSIIFSIYLLTGKERLIPQVKRVAKTYLKESVYHKINYVLHTLNESFHSFIVGQCVEAVILGSLCAIGMAILRLPYSGMTGALIGFTALIPIAGAYIGGGIGFLMIATVSPMKAVVFVIFLIILQQLEGQLIYPRVVGASIGLPGIWVLAAVTIGGSVMGIGGMLLFVPLTATAYKLLRNDVKKRNTFKK
ncbi:MAG: AI-2E family transporter [Eubacterium sp.]